MRHWFILRRWGPSKHCTSGPLKASSGTALVQLYSNFTYVKSKQKSHCLILFASVGIQPHNHSALSFVIKNFLRDTAVVTPVPVFSEVATSTYCVPFAFNQSKRVLARKNVASGVIRPMGFQRIEMLWALSCWLVFVGLTFGRVNWEQTSCASFPTPLLKSTQKTWRARCITDTEDKFLDFCIMINTG